MRWPRRGRRGERGGGGAEGTLLEGGENAVCRVIDLSCYPAAVILQCQPGVEVDEGDSP